MTAPEALRHFRAMLLRGEPLSAVIAEAEACGLRVELHCVGNTAGNDAHSVTAHEGDAVYSAALTEGDAP